MRNGTRGFSGPSTPFRLRPWTISSDEETGRKLKDIRQGEGALSSLWYEKFYPFPLLSRISEYLVRQQGTETGTETEIGTEKPYFFLSAHPRIPFIPGCHAPSFAISNLFPVRFSFSPLLDSHFAN